MTVKHINMVQPLSLLLVDMILWISVTDVTCEVSLSLPISIGHVKPGDHLVFTCVTRGSSLLSWTSDEYIGSNGETLTLTTANNFRSPNRYTNASIIDSYTDGGVTVLVSRLEIIVQPRLPESSITCRNVITGEAQTANFSSSSNPDVVCGHHSVCPGDSRTFLCETRGSNIVVWMGTSYTMDPIMLNVTSEQLQNQVILGRGETTARLITSNVVNGIKVILSEFNITVTPDIQGDIRHYITCVNYDLQTEGIIAIRMKDNCASSNAPTSTTVDLSDIQEDTTMVSSSQHNTTEDRDVGVMQSNIESTKYTILLTVLGVLISLVLIILTFLVIVIFKCQQYRRGYIRKVGNQEIMVDSRTSKDHING